MPAPEKTAPAPIVERPARFRAPDLRRAREFVMQSLRSRLARFREDKAGAVAILFAITIMPMLFAGAMTIEYTNTLLQRDKVQNAADALLLRAATSPITSPLNPKYVTPGHTPEQTRSMWEGRMMTQFKNAFKAVGVNEVGTGTIPVIKYDDDAKTITLKYSLLTESLFPKILRPDEVSSITSMERSYIYSQVKVSSDVPIEIALVFDISSSMNRPGKFTTAVAQAKTFISDMMSSPGTTMAIVPFGDRVAVDRLNTQQNYYNPPYVPTETDWVQEGYNKFGLTRDGEKQDINSVQWPIQGAWAILKAREDFAAKHPDLKNWPLMEELSFCPELPSSLMTIDDTPQSSYVAWLHRYDTVSSGWAIALTGSRLQLPCPDRRAIMQPLTESADDLKAKMDMLVPWDGGTRIDHGLLWGWYNVSPKWQKRFDPDLSVDSPGYIFNRSRASNRPAADAKKYIVMFTDGENYPSADYFRCLKAKDIDPKIFCQNQTREAPDKPPYVPSPSLLDMETLALCTRIKNAGIQIYYVQYQTNSTALNSCASSSNHFFNAADSDQLLKTFRKIRDGIKSTIHLSQ
jgi:hypothetical protein